MFCNNCGNRLIDGARFCNNCGKVIGQDPGRKSKGLSRLALTSIITASIVVISCMVSWFFFFAGPPVDTSTSTTKEPGIEMTTKETSAASQVEPSTYDAMEKPVFDDFLWYTNDIFENGRPDQAIQLNFSELQGNWKALIWYDRQNVMDAEGWDSLLIGISGSPDDARLRLDWQDSYVKSTDSIVDMSALADTEMIGRYDAEGIKAGDSGYEFYITDFYLWGDFQYAVGYMLVESGEDIFVALVRP